MKYIYLIIMLVYMIKCDTVLAEDEEWFCRHASSSRGEDTYQVCGIGLGSIENEARENAVKNAFSEFRHICEQSINCKGYEIEVTPLRTDCDTEYKIYRCYRALEIQVTKIKSEKSNTQLIEDLIKNISEKENEIRNKQVQIQIKQSEIEKKEEEIRAVEDDNKKLREEIWERRKRYLLEKSDNGITHVAIVGMGGYFDAAGSDIGLTIFNVGYYYNTQESTIGYGILFENHNVNYNSEKIVSELNRKTHAEGALKHVQLYMDYKHITSPIPRLIFGLNFGLAFGTLDFSGTSEYKYSEEVLDEKGYFKGTKDITKTRKYSYPREDVIAAIIGFTVKYPIVIKKTPIALFIDESVNAVIGGGSDKSFQYESRNWGEEYGGKMTTDTEKLDIVTISIMTRISVNYMF